MNSTTANHLKKARNLIEIGNCKQAKKLCLKVLKRSSNNIEAKNILAQSYYFQRDFEDAIKIFKQILEIDPNQAEARIFLFGCYRDSSQTEAMLKLALQLRDNPINPEDTLSAFSAFQSTCNWHEANKLTGTVISSIKQGEIPLRFIAGTLLDMNTIPEISADDLFDIHRYWGNESKKVCDDAGLFLPSPPAPHGKLKIGYLSVDFNKHPVGHLALPVIQNHDKEKFEIFCYARLIKDDLMTDEFRMASDHFIDISDLSHAQAAQRISHDGIHILIDLSGHTANSPMPIMAFKPAPVQINYLGYPNTYGLSTIDYRITDQHSDAENGTHYVEELLKMPVTFLCMRGLPDVERSQKTPAELTKTITFGSFNHIRKMNPQVVEAWAQILQRVDNSKMLIKSSGCHLDIIKNNILNEFFKNGITSDRVEFSGYINSYDEHAALYNRVDIVLDTFPYHGTHTTLEALWMGVPVITLEGTCHVQRVSSSILKCIGFDSTITHNVDAYIEKAVELAFRPESLSVLRKCIHTLFKHSLIFNPAKVTQQLEEQYLRAWEMKMGYAATVCSQSIPTNQQQAGKESLTASPNKHISPLAAASRLEMTKAELAIDPQTLRAEQSLTLSIEGNIKIEVPNNVSLMTPYVLFEQQDWFEDEIKFIRKIIKPSMNILDIGANYGCYAMTMAKLIGKPGHLWAFEPATNTASFLRKSIKTNRFKNITLVNAALSNREGSAELALNCDSELNSITEKPGNSPTESVVLKRLDDCIDSYKWNDISFVKLDAEGEEVHILEGGQTFFSSFSPLVMFEIKHGAEVNVGLIQKFKEMNYQSYHLIPGLDLLVPFNHNDNADDFLLNLFCCKEDRAKKLANDGRLMLLNDEQQTEPTTHWSTLLTDKRYANKLLSHWLSDTVNDPLPGWESYELALNYYASAHTGEQNETRSSHLQQSFIQLVSLLDIHITTPRLMTLARVATELGQRVVAVQVLSQIIQMAKHESSVDASEPFLAASVMAESTDTDNRLDDWFLAMALATKEKLHSYTSYTLGQSPLPDIEKFLTMGYKDDAMQRRNDLIRLRFNLPPKDFSTSAVRKLHIGGQVKHPEWEIMDANDSNIVDHIGNANDLTKFKDNTFEALYSSHVLEHFSYHLELPQVLAEWYRVIKPGGTVYASVPNLDILCELFLNKTELSSDDRFLVMRMMYGGQIDAYDFHKIGYDPEILAHFLGKAGFKNIRKVENFGLFNDTSNMEFAGKRISLNLIAEK